jgi:hypothetical protein
MTATEAAPPTSNSLRVPLAGQPSAAGVLKRLEAFGELARIDMLEGAVVASYFDARAARQAMEAFGPCCVEEAQHGIRSVRLTGGHRLDRDVIPEVSKIELCEDRSFLVEFFDTRVAARVARSVAVEPAEAKAAADAGEERVAADPELSAPARRLLCEQVKWESLRGGREWRTVLLLRGLPRSLCSKAAMEALLERHGLREGVESIAARPSNGKIGSVMLRARSVESVPALAKFFHGQQFSSGSPPVAVSYAPAHVQGGKRPAAGPAESTSASSEDSGHEAESWSRGTSHEAEVCQERPPGLALPPGLEAFASAH